MFLIILQPAPTPITYIDNGNYTIEQTMEEQEIINYLYKYYDLNYILPATKFKPIFQTDYYNTRYANGTVRSAGCSITSYSMVLNYYLEENITPDILAKKFNSSSPAAGMEAAIRYYKIEPRKYYGNEKYDEFLKAAKEDKPIILLYNKTSMFTNTGHFVLFAGLTKDNKFIIYDPNKFNYDLPDMAEKYKTGFTWEEIKKGLVGCYIFDQTKEDKNNISYIDIYNKVMEK